MSERINSNGEAKEGGEVRPEWSAPRIYAASLSDYNAGRLHGEWMPANQSPAELHAAVQAMLARSPESIAEEWAIHDYEGFGPLAISEYESLEHISALGLGIAEHGLAFAAWAGYDSGFDHLEKFEEAYLGSWPSVEAYAENFLDETGATAELEKLPEWLQPYVDLNIEGFARDLEIGGDVYAVDDEQCVHVFNPNV